MMIKSLFIRNRFFDLKKELSVVTFFMKQKKELS